MTRKYDDGRRDLLGPASVMDWSTRRGGDQPQSRRATGARFQSPTRRVVEARGQAKAAPCRPTAQLYQHLPRPRFPPGQSPICGQKPRSRRRTVLRGSSTAPGCGAVCPVVRPPAVDNQRPGADANVACPTCSLSHSPSDIPPRRSTPPRAGGYAPEACTAIHPCWR